MKKIIYILVIFVLIFLATINVLSWFHTSFFGIRMYKIGSGSMNPYLKINDLIIIKESDNYLVGDVITYEYMGEYITHRIIKIDSDEILTKGDANNIEDDPITREQIIGKLIFRLRFISFIGYLFLKPVTWLLLLIIGLLMTHFLPNKK